MGDASRKLYYGTIDKYRFVLRDVATPRRYPVNIIVI